MKACFTIPIAPRGKDRPRFSNFGVYTTTRTQSYENYVKACYIEECDSVSFGSSPIKLSIVAYVPLLSKFKKQEKIDALNGKIKPSGKPDSDNLIKVIMDALNKLAYDDDKYIYKIEVEKVYSDLPRTEVCISTE